MGYSTMLHAVDIGELQSAFGSNDAVLLERVRSAMQERAGGGKRVDPTKGPRLRVTWKSEIFLNGKQVTKDELKEALLNPEWKGTYLYTYIEVNPPPGQKREGEFKVLGSFSQFFWTLFPFFQERGVVFKEQYPVIESCTESQFEKLGTPSAEITDDRAVAELIAGKLTQPASAHVYGYALEHLCWTIGTFLDTIEGTDLKSLKLKTPLAKIRLPVKLPKSKDFPYVSYLDAEELRDEVARLRTMDLACPKAPHVEEERSHFLQLLEQAAEQKRGVVSFYY